MGKNIGLDVPSRVLPDKNAFNIRPRKLASWIDALPRANLGETAKQIFTVLHQTNQLSYPYQDRIRFLETLREPLDYVTRSMKKHFIGISLPLPEKSQKIASITKELYSSMAVGYKIALEDTLVNNLMIFDKKHLALLVHRSISYIGLNFLTAYQSYSPHSDQDWGELHKLYKFAEKRKILKSKIRDDQHAYIEKTSVATEYARILLLSLASPYHLRQGESGKVYGALERWLNQPIIHALNAGDEGSNKFVDDLAQPHAPMALSLALTKDIVDPGTLRIIDTFEIAEKLERELRNTEDVGASTITSIENINPDLSHDLLQRLLIAWAMASKRHFPRASKNEKVKITIGLSAAHQFITQKAQAMDNGQYTNKYNHRAHFESTEIKLNLKDPAAASNDVWGLLYPSEVTTGLEPLVEQELSLQDPNTINIEPTQQTEAKQYQADNWLIINESAKGLMINNKDELKNKAQVGELVSIRRQRADRPERWSIGVIRWLKFNPDKSLQMGIETLNPNSAAVGIRAASTPNAPLQRTLMLPELINLKQPACLITSPVPWREGNKIVINMLGKEIPATLTKSVQNTGLFSQFQFDINSQDKPEEKTKKVEKEQDFNQIWSSI
ncbi:MAG: hypothetical protein BMS9Abin31_0435 [Gammaproteobacteria bacterium]|nr:MAG: hypothetical protein BMS9Abin31_0435 [Gammaproteobacteria bacterium]